MFLAVDIGNSNIVISINNGVDWKHSFRYESKDDQPTLYYINGLSEILLEWGVTSADIDSVAISSVVPHLTVKIVETIRVVTGKEPFVLGPSVFEQLAMPIPLIYEIGSDLVANSFAAVQRYDEPTLIIDFGTALTFTVVSREKGIEGVSFAPGLKTAMLSLAGNTAQLPEVWLRWPESALGHNTEEAIRAGVLIGYYGLVKELRSQILAQCPHVTRTIGTGGMVTVIEPLAECFDVVDKHITLEGIRLIYDAVGDNS